MNVLSFGKGVFADIIKLRISLRCNYPGLEWDLNPIQVSPQEERRGGGGGEGRGREEDLYLGGPGEDRGRDWSDATASLGSWQPPEARRDKEGSAPEPSERAQPLISDIRSSELCEDKFLGFFKAPSL